MTRQYIQSIPRRQLYFEDEEEVYSYVLIQKIKRIKFKIQIGLDNMEWDFVRF